MEFDKRAPDKAAPDKAPEQVTLKSIEVKEPAPELSDLEVLEWEVRSQEEQVPRPHKNGQPNGKQSSALPERPKLDELSSATIDRVLEMAWEDRTPFEVIEQQFGLKEQDVIAVMRAHMKRSSFKMWRKRVTARKTKHGKKRAFEVGRFRSSNQKNY